LAVRLDAAARYALKNPDYDEVAFIDLHRATITTQSERLSD